MNKGVQIPICFFKQVMSSLLGCVLGAIVRRDLNKGGGGAFRRDPEMERLFPLERRSRIHKSAGLAAVFWVEMGRDPGFPFTLSSWRVSGMPILLGCSFSLLSS